MKIEYHLMCKSRRFCRIFLYFGEACDNRGAMRGVGYGHEVTFSLWNCGIVHGSAHELASSNLKSHD